MPDIDLEDIEALIIAADGDSTTEIATEMLAALVAEVRSLRERNVLLTSVAEAASEAREAERATHFAAETMSATIAALDRSRAADDALDAALDALHAGGEGS